MSTPRRDFLSWLGASTVLAASSASFVPRRADAESLVPVDPTWDVSWTERVTGKYRAIFDSPQLADGSAMFRACVWRDQHQQVYGTPKSDTSAVLVVRHAAMAMIMNDVYWDRFDIGKKEQMRDEKGKKWTRINPFRVAPVNATGAFKEYNLTDFISQGGVVHACGLAFQGAVSRLQKADKLSREEADKVARAHLVPGVLLQPSGIFAALRAQEVGCNYILGS